MSGRDCGHQGSSKRLDATYGSGRRCPKLLPFNLGVADRRLRGGDRSASIAASPRNRPPRQPHDCLASADVPMNGPPTPRNACRGASCWRRARHNSRIERIAPFLRPIPTLAGSSIARWPVILFSRKLCRGDGETYTAPREQQATNRRPLHPYPGHRPWLRPDSESFPQHLDPDPRCSLEPEPAARLRPYSAYLLL